MSGQKLKQITNTTIRDVTKLKFYGNSGTEFQWLISARIRNIWNGKINRESQNFQKVSRNKKVYST